MTTVDTLREFIVDELHWNGKKELLTPDFPLIENHVLDSLGLFSLIAFVEEQFGVEVREDEVVSDNFGTISAITRLIETKRAGS